MGIKKSSNAMKQRVPLVLRPNDRVCSEALAFLHIPYDIRIDAFTFSRQQITTHISEKKGAQHLKAVYCAGEIRCLVVHHAAHFCEALGTYSTNPPHFRIDAVQAEVRTKPNAPRRPGGLEAPREAARA